MISQQVVFTPNTELTAREALQYISSLLPLEVTYYLDVCLENGNRSTVISSDGNTHTVVTEWNDAAVEEYQIMMADVSEGVKAQLRSEGWSITFTPETADL